MVRQAENQDVLRLGEDFSHAQSQPESSVPLEAPSDAVTVTPGVRKHIFSEGKGGKTPPADSKCFVHWTLRLVDDESGKVIDSTLGEEGEKAPVEVTQPERSDGGPLTRGLIDGVYSMTKWERCVFYVTPEQGYGEEGHLSFPSIPPNASLVYSVMLYGWIANPKERRREEMMFEERLEAANRRREWGKDELEQERYWQAWVYFNMGLSYLDEEFMFQLEDKERKETNKIRHPMLLYGSSCLSRLKMHKRALKHAKQVTFEDPDNGKAWYRLAKAYRLKGEVDFALKAIEKAMRREPNSGTLKDELAKIKDLKAKNLFAEKVLYVCFLLPLSLSLSLSFFR